MNNEKKQEPERQHKIKRELPVIIVTTIVMLIACFYTISYQGNKRIPTYAMTCFQGDRIEFAGTNGEEKSSTQCFEAGSISKTVTAYLCLKLVQEGKLSLEDKVIDYVDFDWISQDARFSQITIRDLLSHRAGFSPSFEFGVDKKIYFEPGSQFSYSGVGYIYLQKVIEVACGMGLEQATYHYVFEPLGMSNSTFQGRKTVTPYLSSSSFVLYTGIPWMLCSILLFLAGSLVARRVKKSVIFYGSITIGYCCTFFLLLVILPRMLVSLLCVGVCAFALFLFTRKLHRMKYAVGILGMTVFIIWGLTARTVIPLGPVLVQRESNSAYSLITNAKDMSLFIAELLRVYEKDEEPMQEMFRQQIAIDDSNGWGAGLGIEQAGQAICYWHSGINPGMQSLLVLYPEQKKGILILTNSDYGLKFAKEQANRSLGIEGIFSIP